MSPSKAAPQPAAPLQGATAAKKPPLRGSLRWFLLGSGVSNAGTWMHTVAQSWLVLQLTGSATAVGVAVAAQYVPLLLLSPVAGVVIDRVGARRVLLLTQGLMALPPLVLAIGVARGDPGVLAVDLVAVALGIGAAFESPARQAVVGDLVSDDLLQRALSQVSAVNGIARFAAPAVAAAIIAAGGTALCFACNSLSFLIAFACAIMLPLRTRRELSRPQTHGLTAELVIGLRAALRDRQIGAPLVIITLVSTIAWNYPVVLPALSVRSFHQGAELYGWLTSAMGLGSVLGAFYSARRTGAGLPVIARRSVELAACLTIAAVAPDPLVEMLTLIGVGGAGTSLLVAASASLQLAAGPELRGRVMGLWTVAFLGTTPVGSPLIGWLVQQAGPRYALAAGATSAVFGWAIALAARGATLTDDRIATSADVH